MKEIGLWIKDGTVVLETLRVEMWRAVFIIARIYAEHGVRFVITSGNDGKHMAGSKHYSNEAIDSRTRDMAPALQRTVRDEVKAALGADYDVVLEKDHLHTEYDPK